MYTVLPATLRIAVREDDNKCPTTEDPADSQTEQDNVSSDGSGDGDRAPEKDHCDEHQSIKSFLLDEPSSVLFHIE